MQIGELSSATGLSRDMLRFYEKRGLARELGQPGTACPFVTTAQAAEGLQYG
jgi:hypothetical protein